MSFRRYWAARAYLFEMRFGVVIRESERDAAARDAKLHSDYERTVAILKKRQEQES